MESGTRLGPYAILEQIGKGGMGEVYRAEDTRLGRAVAIKVLPAEFAGDSERLARFGQEARASAALNHPHIAAVFDVGFEDGTHFMVQEYLEGKTLRDALEDGPLPQERALALGTEIAAALRAAHRAGIVHRDLKPENIFVTPDGHAKVLDFGLAKLTEVATAGMSSQSMSPTVLGTQAGTVMGTAGYMAPEQVQGEDVDHRADLFAFGCVLYEMVTGRRAFAGKSVPHTLHKILDEEADGFEAAAAGLPLRLRWLLQRCLAKAAEARAQSAGDVAVELQQIAREVESGTAIGASDAAAGAMAAAARVAPGLSRGAVITLVVLATMVGALGVRFLPAPEPEPAPVTHFEFELYESDGFTNPDHRPLSISPDGTRVAFGDEGLVRLRDFSDPALRDIRGTTSPRTPIFSPDGEWIAFHSGTELRKVPVSGGAPIRLAEIGSPAGMSWSGDGFILLTDRAGEGIARVPDAGGEPEILVPAKAGEAFQGPSLLPGGEWLLFSRLDREASGNWSDAEVVAQSLSSGERRLLVPGGVEAHYVDSGHITFARDGNLLAVPFDASAVEVTGGAVPLVEGIPMAGVGGAYYDISRAGDLIYYRGPGGGGSSVRLAWYDLQGNLEVLPFDPADSNNQAIAPDGNRVAVQVAAEGAGSAVWIYELDRHTAQRLTPGDVVAGNPVWSPDGEWIYFFDRAGAGSIRRIRADFSGTLEPVGDGSAAGAPYDVSADGTQLLVVTEAGSFDIGLVDLGSGTYADLVATPAVELRPRFSPDGSLVAYMSRESGPREIYVRELASGRRHVVSTDGGNAPAWSPDGSDLYYLHRSNDILMRVPVEYEPALRFGAPVEMFAVPAQAGFPRNRFEVSPDGQRFMILTDQVAGPPGEGELQRGTIHVLLNFARVLRDRVVER